MHYFYFSQLIKPRGYFNQGKTMTKSVRSLFASMAIATLTMGCIQSPTPTVSPPPTVTSTASAPDLNVLLDKQPDGAKPVGDVRASAVDGAEVTILGRIGGDTNPWVEGRAAFTIVDPKLEPCAPGEGCPTPWDYCCSTDLLPTNRAMIKVVDAAGGTVEQDARRLLGVKELQTVVITGKAKRDEAGNLTVLAKAVYVVPEKK